MSLEAKSIDDVVVTAEDVRRFQKERSFRAEVARESDHARDVLGKAAAGLVMVAMVGFGYAMIFLK